MKYKFYTTVKSIERIERVVQTDKVGNEVTQYKEDLGWFVHFDGSWEKLHLGFEEPLLKKGQKVCITLEGL